MLSVWLPLNGNLNNQGLSDGAITANGATVSTSGKFGECYQFNGSSSISIAPVAIPPNTPEWSFCCWFCLSDTTTTTATCLFSERSAVGTAEYAIFLYPNNGNILIDDGKRSIFNTMPLTANTWYHLVVLRTLGGKIDTVIGDAVVGSSSIGESTYIDQNNMYRVYINGKLKASRAAGDLGEATTANTNGCLIGSALTTGDQGFKGKINDVRIYTHALSRDEIHRLSQGLALHYPLAMPGQENLVTGSNTNSTATNKWLGHSAVGGNTSTIEVDETGTNCVKVTRDSTAQSSWDYLSYDALLYNQLKTNTIYTVSFDAKPSVNGEITLNGFMRGNATNNMTASVVQIQSNLIANKWNHCVYRCTTLSSFDGITIGDQVVYLFRSTSLKGVNATVLFKNIKVEEGEIVTPWIPSPADTAYAALGFNDGIEYDVSGYGNNATKVGAIVASSNTPRYSVSSLFDGSSYIINNTFPIHLSNEFTIAWWGKVNSWQKKWEGMFLLQNTATLDQSSGTFSVSSSLHRSVADKMALTIRQGGTTYSFDHYNWTYTVGVWAHYACTYKDGVVIMYQNGVQVYTATIDNSSSGDYYYTIGKRVPNCNCQISDFRIYNTALSADEVLKLYNGE